MKKNKIISLIISVGIAVALWAYVVTNINPEDSQWVYNIPVTFTNEDGVFADRNLTLSEGRNATVNMMFHGNRQDLLKLNNTNVTITVDLSQVVSDGTYNLPYEYSLPDSVNASNITIEKRSTYNIEVLIDKLSTKEIEVRSVFVGNVADDYIADTIVLGNDTIEVSGPRDVVDTISYAQVTLERENLSSSVVDTLPIILYDDADMPVESDEISMSITETSVSLQVNMTKDVALTVQCIDGGGATEEYVVTSIEPQTVKLQGDPELLEGLNTLTVDTVYLGNVEDTYTKEVSIQIPDGLVCLTDTIANVTVQLYNLKEKSFRVTNLEVVNTPEDLRATIGTTSLQVKLRGPAETIDMISSSNIRAVADLSSFGSTTGQFSVPVDIYIDGFSEVGAMYTYSVLIYLSEPIETEETGAEISIESEAEPTTTVSEEAEDQTVATSSGDITADGETE